MKRRAIAPLVVVLGLLSGPALAQVSDVDRATARTLGQEGHDALDKKDWATAADRFSRANAIISAPTFLVGLAQAQVGQGKLVSALEAYNRALREGLPRNPPAAFVRALEEAKSGLDALTPRIPFVIIDVKGPAAAAAKVTIDGVAVPTAALGMRRPVDPGRHQVVVEAPGFATTQKAFEVAEGKVANVTVEPPPSAAPAAATPTVAAPPPAPTPPADHGPSGRKVAGFVVGGIGLASLAVGAAMGGVVLGKKSTITANCGLGGDKTACNDAGLAAASDAKTFGIVSDVGFAVGGAAVVTAVVLLLTDRGASRPSAVRGWVGVPTARGDAARLGLEGAW
jgi:hypothetical protein